ncbi:Rossmann-fold NAD(P)-binding domain-containing protein [Jiangella rhizosphaerae]|uniref:NAD-dependent epimerase/dehydratase family protein n=1 Tax=Jiangella rhizosphaerae TaxID=2293569 RepID=A0A418KVP6_9ACTN|nr:hypothetical protein [Jiangella rhizosphaerae]RIQ33683.1 hypothetical protein DY240_04575 [Jiangella rhizosphaerae]
MYAITGITGHVGGSAARELLAAGEQVRAVVRDRGAFVMLPTVPTGTDDDHRRLADSIAAAVAGSGVLHVVMLSSVGADLAEGTGPVRWLHHLENGLRATGVVVTAIRSPHFQEKAEAVLGAVVEQGVYPVFASSADVPIEMVATRDVGAAVAAALRHPPLASVVVGLDAPRYTERQVAAALGRVLDRPLEVVTLPRPAWPDVLRDAGVPPALAAELIELYDAEERGLLRQRGDRRQPCATPVEETLRELVAEVVATS